MGRCHLLIVLLWVLLVSGCGQKAAHQEEVPSSGQVTEHDSATVPDEPVETTGEGPAFPPSDDEPLTTSEPPEVGSEPPPPTMAEPIPRDGRPRETGSRDTEPRITRSTPPDEVAPSGAEPSEAEPSATEPVADDARDRIVKVYYATDRQPHLPPGAKTIEWSLYFPAITGIVTTLILAGVAVYLRGKFVVVIVAVASFLVTAVVTQQMLVRMQQVRRAAEFGDRTYGETRHEDRRKPVLELGVCEVSIPPIHDTGHVESPSILRLEFREDPEKHVVLQRTVRLEEDDFYASLRQTVDESSKSQALVFIHGYNVGFDDAVKRTAQIVFDLKFQGAGICYSWPSNAGLADYKSDEANIGWTVTQLEGFLRDIAERSGAKTVHLIAHSMGNRALLAAIERMSLQGDGPQFGQVILAAPDVDAGEFRTRFAPALARSARQVTLYASSNDRALIASMRAHQYPRAGLSGADIVVTDGVETIDVSPIDTSLIGHSYYGDNPQLIRDLIAMIELNLRAANREWLERDVLEEEEFYWTFREGVE